MATQSEQNCISHNSWQKDTLWPPLPTVTAEESTSYDETGYVSLKDGKGKSHNVSTHIHDH
jgi:hypothetical protein